MLGGEGTGKVQDLEIRKMKIQIEVRIQFTSTESLRPDSDRPRIVGTIVPLLK
jgi:hypothetical protein